MWRYITNPERAYEHIYGSYGWFGVLFAALGIIFVGILIWLWFERRK